MSRLRGFLYSFFSFGVFFAGCLSLQGAILNPTQNITVNGLFYVAGIGIFCFFLAHAVYEIKKEFRPNFWRIRMLVKAILISVSHWSPLSLLVTAVIVDLTLMACEYHFTAYPKIFKKSWLTAHIAINVALLLLVFAPVAILSLVFITLLIIVTLGC